MVVKISSFHSAFPIAAVPSKVQRKNLPVAQEIFKEKKQRSHRPLSKRKVIQHIGKLITQFLYEIWQCVKYLFQKDQALPVISKQPATYRIEDDSNNQPNPNREIEKMACDGSGVPLPPPLPPLPSFKLSQIKKSNQGEFNKPLKKAEMARLITRPPPIDPTPAISDELSQIAEIRKRQKLPPQLQQIVHDSNQRPIDVSLERKVEIAPKESAPQIPLLFSLKDRKIKKSNEEKSNLDKPLEKEEPLIEVIKPQEVSHPIESIASDNESQITIADEIRRLQKLHPNYEKTIKLIRQNSVKFINICCLQREPSNYDPRQSLLEEIKNFDIFDLRPVTPIVSSQKTLINFEDLGDSLLDVFRKLDESSLKAICYTSKKMQQFVNERMESELKRSRFENKALHYWEKFLPQSRKSIYSVDEIFVKITKRLLLNFTEKMVNQKNLSLILSENYIPELTLQALMSKAKSCSFKVQAELANNLKKVLIERSLKDNDIIPSKLGRYGVKECLYGLSLIDPASVLDNEIIHFYENQGSLEEIVKENCLKIIVENQCQNHIEELFNFINLIRDPYLRNKGMIIIIKKCYKSGNRAVLFIRKILKLKNLLFPHSVLHDLPQAYAALGAWKKCIESLKILPYLNNELLRDIAKNCCQLGTKKVDHFLQEILKLKKKRKSDGINDINLLITVAEAYTTINQEKAEEIIKGIDPEKLQEDQLISVSKVYISLNKIDNVKKIVSQVMLSGWKAEAKVKCLLAISDMLKDKDFRVTLKVWKDIVTLLKEMKGNERFILQIARQMGETSIPHAKEFFGEFCQDKKINAFLKENIAAIAKSNEKADITELIYTYALFDMKSAEKWIERESEGKGLFSEPIFAAQAYLGLADAVK